MNWCILIPLIVGLICALLGYLLGKLFGGNSDELNIWKEKVAKLEADLDACNKSKLNVSAKAGNSDELNIWKSKVAKLEADLDACNKSKLMLGADLKSANDNLSSLSLSANKVEAPSLSFDGAAAKAIFGKKIKQDDLKIVEGIGPKIEGLFHNFDIKTWKALSEASIEKCQEVLNSGGDRYKIHKPGTWPKQARLAYEGKWAELLKWQDELDGGKA